MKSGLSSDKDDIISKFDTLLKKLRIEAKTGFIRFPERTVKMILASRKDLERLSLSSDNIAEYRRAKTTADFWVTLPNKEQAEWVEDLLERTVFTENPDVAICILDTGVNCGHPLLSPLIKVDDCQTVNSKWGIHDQVKHGTLMAGLAGYGDLIKILSNNQSVHINHGLESVKIIPFDSVKKSHELWGDMTLQGISLAEIQSPDTNRIICMAVAAEDTRDRGRPTSWSGKLDQLAAGVDDDTRRLMIVCAGNADMQNWNQYPAAQLTDSVHDPAQSWNAIAVGAFTDLDTIKDKTFSEYRPLAPKGGLSPFSTTSVTWEDNKWPLKPDIVLEGGNLAIDGKNFTSECDDLSLLSTHYDPQHSHFQSFNMTSAATAQAAWMAAQIQVRYPEFWPETIRALLIHSAEWTDVLKSQFSVDGSKTDYARLLTICGYGVPNLERALYSAANSLTLIAQSEIQPFDKKYNEKEKSNGYQTKDMHLYDLPWPVHVLQSLPDETKVSMRITLSYFIEPGPGQIGWKERYRYASHALRFKLISPTESKREFIKRVNKAARSKDETLETKSETDHWTIGQARDKGSIHSDIWKGTAAELAKSNLIAVTPQIGWWRERAYLGKWSSKTRYSLVVSIHTPEEEIDLYTPVATQIGITIPTKI
ncbi:MAG: S8 family peptidase [candidate division KSB1 bacterium]|nr:S8 family peptidase [candidate division KSB1 bacterium]